DDATNCSMPGQLRPGGFMMRDCLKNRAGFDRVLMAVAATFLTVSATSALAQADPPRKSAAELAIDAAIPRPDPANIPPPTINDFKLDTSAPAPDTAKIDAPKAAEKAPDTKPSDVVAAPSAEPNKADTAAKDTVTTPTTASSPAATTASPAPAAPAAATATPAAEPVKAASNVPPEDQPVADKLHEMLGGKSLRYFDRKAERTAVEKFYTAREFAPLWTQGGTLTE